MTKHEEAVQVFKQGIRFGGSRRWAALDAIETLRGDKDMPAGAIERLQIAVGAIVGGEDSEDYSFREVLG